MKIPDWCRNVGTVFIYMLLLVSTGTLMCLGIAMYVYTSNMMRTKNYVPSTCNLISSSLVEYSPNIQCNSQRYLSVWQSKDGFSVSISPVSGIKDKTVAQNELNDYPLNTDMRCLCDINFPIKYPSTDKDFPCTFYTRCFLATEIVELMQSQTYYNNIGIVIIIFTVAAIVIMVGMACMAYSNFCEKRKYNPMQDESGL